MKEVNKMKKTAIFGILAILLVGLLTVGLVSAYREDPSVQGPDYSEERHEAMEDAFESLDYDAWYNLMAENGRSTKVMGVVTEDNFAIFAQAHEAAENGDFETSAALRAELGLNNGNGPRDGTGFGKGKGMGQGRNAGNGFMKKSFFVDADNDGRCDNVGQRMGQRQKGLIE